MNNVADRIAETYEVLKDLVQQVSKYNSPDMIDGYLDGLGHEFNSRLTDLGLPTIHLSLVGEVDKQILDECIVEYDREKDTIYVYRSIIDGGKYLKACIGGHQVGFEVQHCSSNEEVKRLMIDSDGWNTTDLGLDDHKRQWVARHDPKDECIHVYSMDMTYWGTIYNEDVEGGISDCLSYEDMMDIVKKNYTGQLIADYLQIE